MINRLFASVAILSVILALVLSVLWWRAQHGHSDTVLHLGANSAHQTRLETGQAGIALMIQRKDAIRVGDYMKVYRFRDVMGGMLVVPALWGAVRLRRRLLPRRPGSEIPAFGRR